MQEVRYFSRYFSIETLLENPVHHTGIVAVNASENEIVKATSHHTRGAQVATICTVSLRPQNAPCDETAREK